MDKSQGAIHNECELEFAVFCIEAVAEILRMGAREVFERLAVRSKLLFDYAIRCYDALHTQDKYYVADELVDRMREEGVLP